MPGSGCCATATGPANQRRFGPGSRARAVWIATLDGDGQNDPADIPALLDARDAGASDRLWMVAGVRRKRRDSTVKRLSSRIANAIRRRVLRDATTDTGCGLKLFRRDAYLALPFFDHMHRFLPALIRRAGGAVLEVPVNHRPRTAGASHYGMWDRAWVGLIDMLGVAWLQRRMKSPIVEDPIVEDPIVEDPIVEELDES
jgi:dolichol-phosphate mannosyltransferase